MVILLLLLVSLSWADWSSENQFEKLRVENKVFFPRMGLMSPLFITKTAGQQDRIEKGLTYKYWPSEFDHKLEPQVRIEMGNEVGDPLFNELINEEKVPNHNPQMRILVNSEFGGLDFDQPDHYSNDMLSYRSRKIDRSKMGEDANNNLAWFGENLPHYSWLKAGLHYDLGPIFFFANRTQGWEWKLIPTSQEQVPLEIRTTHFGLKYSDLILEYGFNEFEGAGLLDTSFSEINYSVGFSSQSWRLKQNYQLMVRHSELVHIDASMDLQYEDPNFSGGFRFEKEYQSTLFNLTSQYKRVNFEFYPLVGASLLAGNQAENEVYGWDVKPEETSMNLFLNTTARSEVWVGVGGSPIGHFSYQLTSGLINQFDQMKFALDSTREEARMVLRSGKLKRIEDVFWGGFLRWNAELAVHHVFWFESSGYVEWRENDWKKISDYNPPVWSQGVTGKIVLPTNLKILGSLVFRDGYQLSGFTENPTQYPWGVDWSLGVEQYFLKRDLSFSAYFLDILASNQKEFVNSSANRFRIITQAKYRF